ncbi:hypothetical protein ACP275_09G069800 [Erythranthe tilingii]
MEVLPSKDKIKPSSFNLHQNFQKIKLSNLDQLAPPTYVGLIFFYESSPNRNFDRSRISQNLKESLSNVLTKFHPLAGRINREDSCIDCNDNGVVYVETLVRAHISEATENPDLTELFKYVPLSEANNPEEIPLCIQVCGGFAVGVCISHKIADIIKSLVFFMNSWADACRNNEAEEKNPSPNFNLSSHFPPLDLSKLSSENAPPTDVNMVTKRFVFDKDTLLVLKKYGVSSKVTNPSKIEAVTAFLWKSFIVSTKEGDLERGNKTKFAAMHAVNVRSRANNPPILEETFGNACTQAIAWSSINDEQDQSYLVLVAKLREAVKKIDGDYICGMKNGDRRDKLFDDDDDFLKEGFLEVCIFSSWCNFPIYEVNYGWGEPRWVSTYPVPHKNLTVFTDTKSGDGIEAWVTMAEVEMAVIEKNYRQLLSNEDLNII